MTINIKSKLPIGIENFVKIHTMGVYYVDKTGLNNLQMFSITNVQFDEHLGFTDEEVLNITRIIL